jgi:predicted nuclease of predicted toxin-antitoxin system
VHRLLTDQDFRRPILRGLGRVVDQLDERSLRDVGLAEADDEDVLRFALREERTLLTHDTKTMPGLIERLMRSGDPVPHVILVPQRMPTASAIEQVAIVLVAGTDADWVAGYIWLPI